MGRITREALPVPPHLYDWPHVSAITEVYVLVRRDGRVHWGGKGPIYYPTLEHAEKIAAGTGGKDLLTPYRFELKPIGVPQHPLSQSPD